MQRTHRKAYCRAFISFLLTYTLIISLSPLPLTRQVISAPSKKVSTSKQGSAPLLVRAAVQEARSRSGEVLVKFRAAASEQNKNVIAATHGVERKKRLRGESGVEKLEVLGGQNPETVAGQLRVQP